MSSTTEKTETKHTEGPWRVEDEAFTTVIRDGRDVKLADVHSYGRNPGRPDAAERRANARLIAAAPDLLEALKAAGLYLANRKGDDEAWSLFSRAVSVIAKATSPAEQSSSAA